MYIFILIIHFIPYILYQDPHEDETMPAWPPLILDQSNNLLVKMVMMIVQLINAVVMYPPQKCKPNELSLKVANETSGVRRLTVPSGQTVTLYCPKTSFENYQGLWERHFHLRTSNLEPMFSCQIFHGGVYKSTKGRHQQKKLFLSGIARIT